MKSLRSIVHVLGLSAALGAAVIAAAATPPASPSNAPGQGPMRHDGRHGPGGPDAGIHRVLEQLDLTAEQKTQIRSIFEQAKPRLQAAHESGRASREQLIVMPPTDPAYAGMLASAKSNAAEQIQLTSDLWTQVYAKLTPDQRARIPTVVAAQRAERDARTAGRKRLQP
jgi:Spy/CpxP family protein refolding chaperone